MSKYLYWRGESLWCRYPLPDHPRGHRYPLGLRSPRDGSRAQCEREALKNGYLPVRADPHPDLLHPRQPVYNPTVGDLCDRFRSSVASNLSSSVRVTINGLKKRFGKRFWDQITVEDLHTWVTQAFRQKMAVATAKNYTYWLQRVFEFASSETDLSRRIPTNPIEKFQFPKMTCAIRTHYVPPESFHKYLNWFQTRFPEFVPFYTAMILTGRRPSEIAKWDWNNVGEEQHNATIIHFIEVPSLDTKTKTQDRVYIPEDLWAVIKMQGWRNGYVFRNTHTGKPWASPVWNYRIRVLKRAFPNDPILQKMVPRDTRRGLISYRLEYAPVEERWDAKVTQQVVGHKTISSTERYRVANKERLLEAVFPSQNNNSNSTKTHNFKKQG